MKSPSRFFLITLSVILFTCWICPTSSLGVQSAQSMDPPIELAQASASPGGNTSSTLAPLGDRHSIFLEADRLYREGSVTEAESLYRQVKPEFDSRSLPDIPEPLYEDDELSAESLVYWNNALAFIEDDDEDNAILSLQLLFESEPGFVPGIMALTELMMEEDQEEEAIAILEQSAALYPTEADIIMAQVLALSEEDDHLEASIAAREFALLNLDHPQAPEFQELAEDEFRKFSRSRRRRGFFSGVTSIVGSIFLGGEAPWESWDSAMETAQMVRLMVGSESEFGAAIAREYSQQLTLVDNPDVVDYVTQLGLEVARLMGRDFDYEFYVVQDNTMNAFALPGGKIFVNTGAILAANSQAELAGVLAHEAAHSVLSHGMQSFFRDNLLSQMADEIPLGDFVTTLVSLHYSRRQERQSDILGNRALATAGYAADGLRNFMVSLGQNAESGDASILSLMNLDGYLSSHPLSETRVEYLEELIQRNGYNRYALEGVDRHSVIQALLG